ncbi:hypothetical protein [Nitrospirillum amazonense]|uniref:SCP domain-containing protein n=1 Tax=Nitrospirillum amazonense TaxID=28077 RepID=A0A560J4Q6_9PROT|nr:hypothetical protein [Nitrospirillum amazonense]MDG3440835.1 hypothetical protein [Nitrospirillum amazonense]TWB66223.1 hypothetical protein FBZ87_11514 [Nitrospirillum amazonense]
MRVLKTLMLTTALLASGGAVDVLFNQAVAAVPAGTPVTMNAADRQAAETLVDFLQKTRIQAGLPALSRQPVLDDAAAARAMALASGTQTPDLRQGLIHSLYVPMQDIALEARASGDPGQPLAIWQDTGSTVGALATPGMTDVGVARVANPAPNGPNDAYIWVVVLAQPLRTPAESPDSPRWSPK